MQGLRRLKGDGSSAEFEESIQEAGIEGEAEVGQRSEFRGIFGVVGGEHAGGGGRGFAHGLAAFEDRHGQAALFEFQGKREADDPGTSDADVHAKHVSQSMVFQEPGPSERIGVDAAPNQAKALGL